MIDRSVVQENAKQNGVIRRWECRGEKKHCFSQGVNSFKQWS